MANARPWEDLELRNQYRNRFPYCEVVRLFPRANIKERQIPYPNGFVLQPMYQDGHDIHHVTGGLLGTPRWDLDTNLIHLCRDAHVWVERFTFDGLVLCVTAKLTKGDWDWEKINEITRMNVRGFLDTRKCEFTFAEEMREVLIGGQDAMRV